MAVLWTSPVAGSGWLGMWQVTNRFSGDKQATQAGMGELEGRAVTGGHASCVCHPPWQPGQGGLGPVSLPPRQVVPWGKVYYWLRARVEACQVPAVKGRQEGQSGLQERAEAASQLG